jgi:acetylornithine deacetylase/succinyl-diaminopimelate desuccinylase-like protein
MTGNPAIDFSREQLIDLCRTLVALDSSQGHGTFLVAKWAAEFANIQNLNVDVLEESVEGIDYANVLIRKKGSKGNDAIPEFLLLSRLDTLDPGEYGMWQKTGANPFHLSLIGDRIYGLGVANSKADFICKLLALAAVENQTFTKMVPVVVGTFGPENSAGTLRMIRKKAIRPGFVLASAPTDLKIATRAPGFAKVEIRIPFSQEEIAFRERHSQEEGAMTQTKIFHQQSNAYSNIQIENNVILKMIDYLGQLPSGMNLISIDGGVSAETEPDSATFEIDLSDGIHDSILPKLSTVANSLKLLNRELVAVVDSHFSPSHSTLNVGSIRSDNDGIVLSGLCRLVPSALESVYEHWLDKLKTECAKANANLRICDYQPPFDVRTPHSSVNDLKSLCQESFGECEFAAYDGSTEANVFFRRKTPVVLMGPGQVVKRAHASEESVEIGDLVKAIQFYKRAIERMCL